MGDHTVKRYDSPTQLAAELHVYTSCKEATSTSQYPVDNWMLRVPTVWCLIASSQSTTSAKPLWWDLPKIPDNGSRKNEKKDYAFQRQRNEKPSVIPGSPGLIQPYLKSAHMAILWLYLC